MLDKNCTLDDSGCVAKFCCVDTVRVEIFDGNDEFTVQSEPLNDLVLLASGRVDAADMLPLRGVVNDELLNDLVLWAFGRVDGIEMLPLRGVGNKVRVVKEVLVLV